MDVFGTAKRSEIMSRIRGKHTAPERKVRSLVHAMGYRFRLHRADLPGKPDLVFPSRRKVIFVHGCFWHSHGTCRKGRSRPATRAEFWGAKICSNKRRDRNERARLRRKGWRTLVVWECELSRDMQRVAKKVTAFLEGL